MGVEGVATLKIRWVRIQVNSKYQGGIGWSSEVARRCAPSALRHAKTGGLTL